MLGPLMLGAGGGAKTSESGKGGSGFFPTISGSNSLLPRPRVHSSEASELQSRKIIKSYSFKSLSTWPFVPEP